MNDLLCLFAKKCTGQRPVLSNRAASAALHFLLRLTYIYVIIKLENTMIGQNNSELAGSVSLHMTGKGDFYVSSTGIL